MFFFDHGINILEFNIFFNCSFYSITIFEVREIKDDLTPLSTDIPYITK